MFSSLRQNSPFYILDKSGDVPTLTIGSVVSVESTPPKYTAPLSTFPITSLVDVSVKVGEEVQHFKELPPNLSIVNFGTSNIVVSDNTADMSAEVESMLRNSKQALDSIPYHRGVMESCDPILRQLNPQMAKEQEQREKMEALENKVSGVEKALSNIELMLSKALAGNKNQKS